MKSILTSLAGAALIGLSLQSRSQSHAQPPSTPPLPQWNFNGTDSQFPTTGVGSWSTFGGVTNTVGSGVGSSDPLGAGDQALSLTGFQGATNTTALAGIEFSADTRGYRDLTFRFDLRATATANRNVQIQYSLDDGRSYQDGPLFVLTNAGAFVNGLVVDFREIPEAAELPNLRVRLISAVSADGQFEGVTSKYRPTGTWRLDQVMFLGEPLVPIPPIIPVAAPVITFTNFITGRTHHGEPATHSFAEFPLRPGETLRLVVEVHDTNNLPVELYALGPEPISNWEWTEMESPDRRATFNFTATEADAGNLLHFGIRADNGSTNDWWWTLYVPTPAERELVISEFLANPPVGTLEFVELVHLGNRSLDLTAWTVEDGTSVRHRFSSGTTLPPGQAVVIFGGRDPIPAPPATAEFVSASTGGLSLNNGGDTLVLRNADSNVVERVVYRAAELASNSSLVRDGLPDGAYRAHSSLVDQAWSPGEPTEGYPWPVISGGPPVATARFLEGDSAQIEISWIPQAGQLARVLRAAEIGSPFEEVARDLTESVYVEEISTPEAFYRVEWQQ